MVILFIWAPLTARVPALGLRRQKLTKESVEEEL